MRRILNYTLLLTMLIPVLGKAQESAEPMKLSLKEAMDLGAKNNVNTKNARLEKQKQKAVNNEVTGIAYPQISAKGEYNDYLNPVQSFVPAEFVGGPPKTFIAVPFTPKYGATASATASQILFDGGVMVALQARNALLKLYDQQVTLTEQEVKYNIQKVYYAIIVTEKQFETITETMNYVRAIGRETQAYYDNGFTEMLDVDRINVQINNLAADSIRIGSAISVLKDGLKYAIGIDVSTPIELSDNTIEAAVNEASQLLLDDVQYNDRTDYLLLQTTLKLHQYDLKRHRLSGVPSLAAFGTAAYTYQTNTFNDIFDKQYIFYSLIGLRLNVPIFDGWQRHSRAKQAKLNIQQTRNNINDLENKIEYEEKQYKTSLKNAIYTMNNQQRNYELAKKVLETTRTKYNAGVGASTEVAQAQTEMLQAQGNYFQSVLDVINAQSDLQKALGQF
ncbi:MAG: TolC family protein [Chitinophagales bacterium]|nr:TolC family protein [Chitinophagaceae bacterium]MCB9065479.1 TolC family protein [Chitinophagales bacterium]